MTHHAVQASSSMFFLTSTLSASAGLIVCVCVDGFVFRKADARHSNAASAMSSGLCRARNSA
eukprot:6078657-Amphidinium_carterae.1